MYPDQELIRLAAHKAVLHRKLALRRAEAVEDAARLVQPLEWLDRVIGFWRRVSPLAQMAALPLGLLFQKTVFPRAKILSSLVRWAPLVFSALRGMKSASAGRAASAKSGVGQSG